MSQNTGESMAQWTVGGTARATYVMFGFVPDYVRVFINHSATNPDILEWFNKATLSQWLDADDHLLLTGSTGVVTRVTTGIAAYAGGDTIAADETISSNPVHVFTDGTFAKAGLITPAGIFLPAAILTANGLCVAIAHRRVADQKVSGLATS